MNEQEIRIVKLMNDKVKICDELKSWDYPEVMFGFKRNQDKNGVVLQLDDVPELFAENTEKQYYIFNGKVLTSNMTIDDMFKEVMGCDKKTWQERHDNYLKDFEKHQEEMEKAETEINEYGATIETKELNTENILNGLNILQTECEKGSDWKTIATKLIDAGCHWKIQDLNKATNLDNNLLQLSCILAEVPVGKLEYLRVKEDYVDNGIVEKVLNADREIWSQQNYQNTER